jgi:NMD protein affecting ribosome stability and mRNA decay
MTTIRVFWEIDVFRDDEHFNAPPESAPAAELAKAAASYVQDRHFMPSEPWCFNVSVDGKMFAVDLEDGTVEETTLVRNRTCPRCKREHTGTADLCFDCSGDDDATG